MDGRLLPFWEAFWDLTGSRQVAFDGAASIPVSEILAYCTLLAIAEPGDRLELLDMVQAMDDEWLAIVAERRKAAEKRSGRPG